MGIILPTQHLSHHTWLCPTSSGLESARAKILADLNLAVRYRIAIRIYTCKKYWRTLIWRLSARTAKFNSPPNFPAIRYLLNIGMVCEHYKEPIEGPGVRGCNCVSTGRFIQESDCDTDESDTDCCWLTLHYTSTTLVYPISLSILLKN